MYAVLNKNASNVEQTICLGTRKGHTGFLLQLDQARQEHGHAHPPPPPQDPFSAPNSTAADGGDPFASSAAAPWDAKADDAFGSHPIDPDDGVCVCVRVCVCVCVRAQFLIPLCSALSGRSSQHLANTGMDSLRLWNVRSTVINSSGRVR